MKNRLLFLEGSSLTSRETLTVLLKEGYKVDVLSPDKFSIATFSRLTHRIPTVDVNRFPLDYLKQVNQLLHQKIMQLFCRHMRKAGYWQMGEIFYQLVCQ